MIANYIRSRTQSDSFVKNGVAASLSYRDLAVEGRLGDAILLLFARRSLLRAKRRRAPTDDRRFDRMGIDREPTFAPMSLGVNFKYGLHVR